MPAIRFRRTVVQVGRGGVALFKKIGTHDVYQAVARQRRLLLAGESKAVGEIINAYDAARISIEARLKAVVDKIAAAQAAGEVVSPAWLYQQERWTAFVAQIQAEIEAFAAKAAAVTQTAQAQSVAQGTKDAKDLVVASGVRGGFTMLPARAFEDVVGLLTDRSPVADLFKQMAPDAVTKARQVFGEELAAGQHPRVIARRLTQEIQGLTRQRATLIARTESIRAYTTAQQRNYEANSDVVVASRVVSARDARTCPLCVARDGLIIPHGEKFARHPGCRCALAPVVKYLDTGRGTGEEWLKKQSPDFQQKLLGPSRYAMWQAGEITLPDLVEETDHKRWGLGLRAKNLNTLGKEVAAGATGKQILISVPGMGLNPSQPPGSFPPQPTAPTPAPSSATHQPKQKGKKALPAPQPNLAGDVTPNSYALQLLIQQPTLTGKAVAAQLDVHFPGHGILPATINKAKKTIQSNIHSGNTGVMQGHLPGWVPPAPANAGPGWTPPAPVVPAKAVMNAAGVPMTPLQSSASPPPAPTVVPPPAPPPAVPAAIPAPVATIPAPGAATPALDASVILHQQVGAQGGSNPGGLYLGSDGVERYVKFYADASQAQGEHLANEVYRALGLNAPQSVLFTHNGKVAYASEILPVQGTVGKTGLDKATAREILDGFAADVLTGNWDAVGMGLDNVVKLQGGGVARIDQGGTFLFRAKNGKKPNHVLNDITEWDGFAPGGVNPDYARVFQAAGYADAEAMKSAVVAQIRAIEKARAAMGGSWDVFVAKHAPGLGAADRAAVTAMLDARTDLLVAKAQQLSQPKKKPTPRVASAPRDPSTLTPRILDNAAGANKRASLYNAAYKTFTAQEKAALNRYKNGSYRQINAYLRGTTTYLDPTYRQDIGLIKSMFRKSSEFDEDILLYRGVRYQDWANLQPGDEGTILTDHSFLSTSNNEQISRSFADASYSKHAVLLRIKAPKGTVAIPSCNPGASDYEHEFILDHANYRVVGITKQPNPPHGLLTILDVELIETQEGETTWNRKIL